MPRIQYCNATPAFTDTIHRELEATIANLKTDGIERCNERLKQLNVKIELQSPDEHGQYGLLVNPEAANIIDTRNEDDTGKFDVTMQTFTDAVALFEKHNIVFSKLTLYRPRASTLKPLLQHLPDLKELTIRNGCGIDSFTGIRELHHLETLDIYRSDSEGLGEIGGLHSLTSLTLEELSDCRNLNFLIGLNNLSRLTIRHSNSINDISGLRGLRNLKELTFYRSAPRIRERAQLLAALPHHVKSSVQCHFNIDSPGDFH